MLFVPLHKTTANYKSISYTKQHANLVTPWWHDDWCRCTREVTLGEGESHLVKANAVDPKLWKVRETFQARDIRSK